MISRKTVSDGVDWESQHGVGKIEGPVGNLNCHLGAIMNKCRGKKKRGENKQKEQELEDPQ